MIAPILAFASVLVVSSQVPESEVKVAFDDFKSRFGRTYQNQDEQTRFIIFQANYEKIQTHNAKNPSYRLGVTRFSDVTHEEFLAQTANSHPFVLPANARIFAPNLGFQAPTDMDWVAAGAVTPVQDQGSCGSCWSFAAAEAMEGAYFLASKKLVPVSVQEWLSCDAKTCNGGLSYMAFDWAVNQTVCTASSFPYGPYPGDKPLPSMPACISSTCDAAFPAGTVTGYEFVTHKNESALMLAVAQQPIAVNIDGSALSQYRSGIISGQCAPYSTDHAVLLVGYGSDGGIDYWKLKNSWGEEFGEKGYFRLKRDDKACANYKTGGMGILSSPTLPNVVAKSEIVV